MTPEQEARLKAQTLERLERRLGKEYVERTAGFLEWEWEMLKEFRLLSIDDLEDE